MNLNFYIDYQTHYGQELILNVVNKQGNGDSHVSECKMQTLDGRHWFCQLNSDFPSITSIDYF